MAKLTLQALGRRLLEKRGDRGVRETAAEIGIRVFKSEFRNTPSATLWAPTESSSLCPHPSFTAMRRSKAIHCRPVRSGRRVRVHPKRGPACTA